MKFHINGGYLLCSHNNNPPDVQVFPFIVNASANGYSRDFLVMATDGDAAIKNLVDNCKVLLVEYKKRMSPEDLLPQTRQVHNEGDVEKASELTRRIGEMTTRIDELGERDDDFAQVTRETLTETIEEHRQQIQKLRETHEETFPSAFDRQTKRTAEIPGMNLIARKLDPQRCYSVAYFDDCRDYTGL